MHFKINKSNLVYALSHVNKAVSSKNTIPILTGIKFEITESGLTLTGADSDISIQIEVPLKTEGKDIIELFEVGAIVLPRYVYDIVRKLPADEIEFKKTEKLSVFIKSGLSEFRINGYDVDEYPEIQAISDKKSFFIESSLLKTMLRQTTFAISNNESRPILTGVSWNLDGETLKFYATDSHRLAVKEAIVENAEEIKLAGLVVPGKALKELAKILEDYDSRVKIVASSNQLYVEVNNIVFISRILDGTYPDIPRIIPKQIESEITLNRGQLIDSIERASLIARDSRNNIVKLVTLENNLVEVSSSSQELGNVTELVEIHGIKGEDVKISFNAKYVLEALAAIENDEIIIEFTGALSPFMLKSVNQENLLHLILPIRTH